MHVKFLKSLNLWNNLDVGVVKPITFLFINPVFKLLLEIRIVKWLQEDGSGVDEPEKESINEVQLRDKSLSF